MPVEDAQFVHRALDGDREAFGALVERYQGAVYGYAYHRLGSFEDAQDVTQDVLLEAYRKLSDLRDPSRFAGWLRGITVNFCKRHLRSRRVEILSFYPVLGEDEDGPTSLGNTGPTPEDALEEKEFRGSVGKLMDRLSEKNRLAVTLRYLDDLSYEEIGHFLSVPISTVKGRLHKSRKQLKEEMIEMVKKGFAENRLDSEFTAQVMKRVGIVEAGIDARHSTGTVWFSTEDDKQFVIKMPLHEAKPVVDGPKVGIREGGKGLSLSTDPDRWANIEREAKPDVYCFIQGILDHFGLRLVNVIIDSTQGTSASAEVIVEQDGRSTSIPLRPSDAIALAGRFNVPVYATRRVLDKVSLVQGETEPIPLQDVLRYSESEIPSGRTRIDVVGRALDEGVDQIRIIPRGDEADVVYIKGEKSREVTTLDAETYDYLRDDALFRLVFHLKDKEGCLYAGRGDKRFKLTPSITEGTSGEVLTLDIEERADE